MTTDLKARLAAAAEATGQALDEALSFAGGAAPARLVEAMRYAVLGGGKRLRPFVMIESARLFGAGAGPAVAAAAAALECVHAYSLVHDDLPAMDDDDFRRGRPTVHRAFDEATAILAGDALLTLAFGILAGLDTDAETRAGLAAGLARAAGAEGMVGGQALDLSTPADGAWTGPAIRALQAMKTGALFAFAAEAGAILAGAAGEDRGRLRRFGAHFGAAFQLADDLDDAAGDETGGRPSLANLLGAGEAADLLRREVEAATAALMPYGERAAVLRDAVHALAP